MKNLDEFMELLKVKRIAVIGAGVSNIPLIKLLIENKCDITLFDKKEEKDINEEIRDYINKGCLKVSLGEEYLKSLEGFDIIFRSPSMLPTNKYLEEEVKRGAYVTTEVEEVIRYAPCKVIGITGSKGKTTTSTIIANILEKLNYKVYLGGNIGTPLFSKLREMKSSDIVVLELSSFQLMGSRVSPDIAVITNISPDHLDVHSSYIEYIDAKKYIFINQGIDDTLVLNYDDEIVREFSKDAKSKVLYFGKERQDNSFYLLDNNIYYNDKKIVDCKELILKGEHNYLNICASLNAVKDLIPENTKIDSLVKDIKSVSHRLEFVREIDGVEWYNDSASTTPDKCLGGLNAFDKPIILIAGGSDKNIPYTPLAKPILEKVSKLILFGATKNKIYDAVMEEVREQGNDTLEIYVMDDLESAVDVAKRVSVKGEVVLFSPASASFDMFKNAYQRGDIFKGLVNDLK